MDEKDLSEQQTLRYKAEKSLKTFSAILQLPCPDRARITNRARGDPEKVTKI